MVQSCDLLHEDAHGRAVRNDVMEDEPQNVVVCIEAYDPRPEEWTGSEVERTVRFERNETRGLAHSVSGRQARQIRDRKRTSVGRGNALLRTTIDRWKRGAQGLVSRNDVVERTLERLDAQ